MGARWTDTPQPATDPHLIGDLDTWLLVMWLLLILAPLTLALS